MKSIKLLKTYFDTLICQIHHQFFESVFDSFYRIEWLLYSGHILNYGNKLTFHTNMQEQFSSIALLVK